MNTKCYYPDWEGQMTVGKHSFDKEGWCTTCGEYDVDVDERPWDRFTRYELVKKVKQLQKNLKQQRNIALLNANNVVKMREELIGLYKELGRVPNEQDT